jgi:phosphatidylglycerol:prolipoprotein diacylglycerol transferase
VLRALILLLIAVVTLRAAEAATGADGHWVHDLSPFIIEFGKGSGLGIRWYGMAYLAGLLWGYWIVRRWSRVGRAPLDDHQLQDFILYAGLGMIIGGRLGYCLLYNGRATFSDPLYIFRLWEGGMASHGGIVGLACGAALFARKRGKSFLVLLDLIGATGPMGIALGRIANFINGELWGRPTDVPWAVIFPASIPTPPGIRDGEVHAWQMAHLSEAVARHPSQLYAAVVEGFLLLLILLPLHARHRRPGLTGGLFLLLYGIGRFSDEFFREPDVGQPVFFGWMTKGQTFTIACFAFAAVLITIALRRPARPDLYLAPAQLEPPAPAR